MEIMNGNDKIMVKKKKKKKGEHTDLQLAKQPFKTKENQSWSASALIPSLTLHHGY